MESIITICFSFTCRNLSIIYLIEKVMILIFNLNQLTVRYSDKISL